MTNRDKLIRYLRKEMKKLTARPPARIGDTTFFFCWGQAKFDVLMDIDRDLELGAFSKRRKR